MQLMKLLKIILCVYYIESQQYASCSLLRHDICMQGCGGHWNPRYSDKNVPSHEEPLPHVRTILIKHWITSVLFRFSILNMFYLFYFFCFLLSILAILRSSSTAPMPHTWGPANPTQMASLPLRTCWRTWCCEFLFGSWLSLPALVIS